MSDDIGGALPALCASPSRLQIPLFSALSPSHGAGAGIGLRGPRAWFDRGCSHPRLPQGAVNANACCDSRGWAVSLWGGDPPWWGHIYHPVPDAGLPQCKTHRGIPEGARRRDAKIHRASPGEGRLSDPALFGLGQRSPKRCEQCWWPPEGPKHAALPAAAASQRRARRLPCACAVPAAWHNGQRRPAPQPWRWGCGCCCCCRCCRPAVRGSPAVLREGRFAWAVAVFRGPALLGGGSVCWRSSWFCLRLRYWLVVPAGRLGRGSS